MWEKFRREKEENSKKAKSDQLPPDQEATLIANIQKYHDEYEQARRKGHMDHMCTLFSRADRKTYEDYPNIECNSCSDWACHFTITVSGLPIE